MRPGRLCPMESPYPGGFQRRFRMKKSRIQPKGSMGLGYLPLVLGGSGPMTGKWLHPRKLTWNPKIGVWKMIFLFKGMVFQFHVSFRGSNNHGDRFRDLRIGFWDPFQMAELHGL